VDLHKIVCPGRSPVRFEQFVWLNYSIVWHERASWVYRLLVLLPARAESCHFC
jgi:hypothetical protein